MNETQQRAQHIVEAAPAAHPGRPDVSLAGQPIPSAQPGVVQPTPLWWRAPRAAWHALLSIDGQHETPPARWHGLALLAVVVLGAILRFWQLASLPGELFGDIIANLEHVASVLGGDFRVLYGADPRESLFYFLDAPFALLFGNTFLAIKSVAALVGIATIVASYMLAAEVMNRAVGLLTAFFVAVSSWPITYSRIGFRNVLTPLIVALVWYLLVRAYKYEKRRDFVLAGLFLGLGLYAYTQFRLAPVIVVLTGLWLWWADRAFLRRHLRSIGAMCLAFVVIVVPYAIDFVRHPGEYFAHPAPMLFVNGQFGALRPDWLSVALLNTWHTLLMYNGQGDVVFRVNDPTAPALDAMSGVLFVLGVIVWLSWLLPTSARRVRVFVLLPFVLLHLSAVLDLNFPIDIPTFTRTIGVIPFVYLFVATGTWWIYQKSRRGGWERLLLALCLTYVLVLNYDRYFNRYAYALPDHNMAYGTLIAQQIDALPTTIVPIVVGSIWGQYGHPEPQGIRDELRVRHDVTFIEQVSTYSCPAVQTLGRSLFIVFASTLTAQIPHMTSCLGAGQLTTVTSPYGTVMYYEFVRYG